MSSWHPQVRLLVCWTHHWCRCEQLASPGPFRQRPLRPKSSQSPLQSPLRPRSSQSPLQSPLRPRSSQSPLQSPLRPRSPQGPLHSPLRPRTLSASCVSVSSRSQSLPWVPAPPWRAPAPVSSAPPRWAPVSSAPPRWAPVSSAPPRWAPVSSAPPRWNHWRPLLQTLYDPKTLLTSSKINILKETVSNCGLSDAETPSRAFPNSPVQSSRKPTNHPDNTKGSRNSGHQTQSTSSS